MSRTVRPLILLGILMPGLVLLNAQSNAPAAPDHAAVAQAADAFMQRLHQTLDFAAMTDLLAPDEAARHREYPGDFVLFPTARMSKALLNQTDDATLRRKLATDRNLFYLTFVLLKADPDELAGTEAIAKALPAEFVKAAKKSKYHRAFGGIPGQTTLISAAELTEFLTEADALMAILRRYVKPEMLAAPTFMEAAAKTQGASGTVTPTIDRMGFNTVYAVGREALLLVFADVNGAMKVITVAPVHQ